MLRKGTVERQRLLGGEEYSKGYEIIQKRDETIAYFLSPFLTDIPILRKQILIPLTWQCVGD